MAAGKTQVFETSAGRYVGDFGNCYLYARIELTETFDEELNKSDVSWTLYMKKYFDQGAGIGNVTGSITVNGQTINVDSYMTIENTWTYITSDSISNIQHNEDGTKTIYITISSLTTDSYAKGYGVFVNLIDQPWNLTDIQRGSKVRIGNKWYYVLIGNGTEFKKQKAHIGTGSTWKNY